MYAFTIQINMHESTRRIIEFPKIEQRTPEWYEYRRSRITASEVSTIIANGKGAVSLMERKKLGGKSSFSSSYAEIGSSHEEAVVKLYEQRYPEARVHHNLSIVPHKTIPYIAASLDACTEDGVNVEIKTCFSPVYVKVCKAYRDQVQLQMEVADMEITHLVQHYIRMENQPLVVHTIKRDREWFNQHHKVIKKFSEKLEIYFPFDMEYVHKQMDTLMKCRVNKVHKQMKTKKTCDIMDEIFEQMKLI